MYGMGGVTLVAATAGGMTREEVAITGTSTCCSTLEEARPAINHVHSQLVKQRAELKLTPSIALLIGTALDPFLALFTLGVDTFFSYTVLDATEARASIIALLACLLTIGTGVFDLTALGTRWLGWNHSRREWIHMHRHARVSDRVHSHLRLNGLGRGLGTVPMFLGVCIRRRIAHGGR